MGKTHFKKLRNPNYIGSYELMTGGEPVEMVVQIEKAVKEHVQNGDKKEEAMVVYLVGQKPMIVNSTNAKAIYAATGTPYIEDWPGRYLTLYVAKIRAFGETVDALRVRKEAPKEISKTEPKTKTELAPGHEKWIGAADAIRDGKTTVDAIKKTYLLTPENEDFLNNLTHATI